MQEASDLWDFLRRGCWGLLAALGRVSLTSLLGALLGAVLGLLGAPVTFGGSLLVTPLLGALLGASVGAFRCLRYYAGVLEALMLYHPRKSRDVSFMDMSWQLGDVEYSIQMVSYTLPNVGPQVSYLLRPSGRVETLWAFFGGNAMLAVDWLTFFDKVLTHMGEHQKPRTTVAFLLVDYPGYGRNAGLRGMCVARVAREPSPERVLESSKLALEAAVQQLHSEVQVQLLGHSLGAAAAAQLAADWPSAPGLLVLSAPFIDIPHMAVQLLSVVLSKGLPHLYGLVVDALPFQVQTLEKYLPSSRWMASVGQRLKPWIVLLLWPVVPHLWDNSKSVGKAAKAGWQIHVLHGAQERGVGSPDDLIPSHMGQTLANLSQKEAQKVREDAFSEIPRAGHNDVVLKGFEKYIKLMGLTDAKTQL
eukprot:g28378.t1